MTDISFPGLDSAEVLGRLALMRNELATSTKRPAAASSKTFKVGDRATFVGAVLRVLPGDAKAILVMVEANGIKLTIGPADIKDGSKLRGGDPVRFIGTVTRVGSSTVEELVPVSLAVDGYTAMRVTLAAKSLRRA